MNLVSLKSNTQFYKDAVKTFSKYSSIKNGTLKQGGYELMDNKEFMEFMKISPGVLCIADLRGQAYVFLSENIKNIMGYSAEEFYTEGLKKTVALFPGIHNEIILNKVFPIMFDHFDRHSIIGDVKDLRVSYCCLMTCSDGRNKWFLHQATVVHTDEDNRPHLMMKLLTDIHEIKKDDHISMSISKKDAKGVYQPIFSQTFVCNDESQVLSKREIEVLSLIGQGKSSKRIADALFISEHTVFQHRKNMLKKLDAKNAGELLTKAIAGGII
jgi:DNA-binding CsgD family transcriptional regulator